MKFVKNVVSEMKAVTWPKFSELIKMTGIVIFSIICLAIFFGAVDMGVGAAIKSLLSL